MRLSLSSSELTRYVRSQLGAMFPDGRRITAPVLGRNVRDALERVEFCFRRVRNKYFCDESDCVFDHLHTDQYSIFLYYLSHTAYRQGERALAGKVYALNKALHGLDVFYEVEMPSVFCVQHPVGTVLGRGHYSDFFFVYQRCSVGSNLDGIYPRIGEGVVMYGGSSIIGDCSVGPNTRLSLNALVMDTDVPAGMNVFGQAPRLTLKPTRRDVIGDLFLRDAR